MSIRRESEKGVYDLMSLKKSWEYIDPIGFTSSSIEHFFSTMTLDVQGKRRDDYIEKKLKLPSMVTYFYYYLYGYKRIPSQKEFIDFYYDQNKKWVIEKVGNRYNQALIGRLSRFYPSMLRDFHFYHLLRESGTFEKVLFVLKYDLEAKVDIFVKKDRKWYGLQLRTLTKNSDYYYNLKKDRDPLVVKAELMDLPINLKTARNIHTKNNSLKVYGEEHIQNIHMKIDLLKRTVAS